MGTFHRITEVSYIQEVSPHDCEKTVELEVTHYLPLLVFPPLPLITSFISYTVLLQTFKTKIEDCQFLLSLFGEAISERFHFSRQHRG
jgi:hypothetical protein